jgi:hypothetical protein
MSETDFTAKKLKGTDDQHGRKKNLVSMCLTSQCKFSTKQQQDTKFVYNNKVTMSLINN